ncbi:MAG: hypothetical protein ACLRMZ_21780 [Blautia marasmi]
MIVAAGNPPEYNKSVREFDMVTLDRIKRIEVTEDYAVWKSYAREHEIHPSIPAYLDVRRRILSYRGQCGGTLFCHS